MRQEGRKRGPRRIRSGKDMMRSIEARKMKDRVGETAKIIFLI